MIRLAFVALAAFLSLGGAAWAADRAPDLVLHGTIDGRDHHTYREVPFVVPKGVARLTIDFEQTGKAEKSVIDLGVRDPERVRGWSGGNKSRVVIEEADATPSYLPGPVRAGTWRLVLGVPNIRKASHAAYTARIWYDRADDAFPGFQPAPIDPKPGWYRGDLHMHTAHSDGECASQSGRDVPCPAFKTVEAAAARGLDFIAVTDHNNTAHNQDLRELSGYFDKLLLIPGREITTFEGHANVFGPTRWIDFQLGGPRASSLSRILDEVDAAHGLFSINHPGLPPGEECMGCRWTAKTDWSRIQVIEAVNGGSLREFGPEGPYAGVPFWEARLNEGHRIAAIGGSDNHEATLDPKTPGAVGYPTTVVHARALSQAAILEAIRQGHVFIDLRGGRDSLLEVDATAGALHAEMGEVLPVAAGRAVELSIHVAGAPAGSHLALAGDGANLVALTDPDLPRPDARRTATFAADGKSHWLRVDLRDAAGALILLGNPIYLRPPV